MTTPDITQYETPALIDWYIRNRDYLADAKKAYEASVEPVEATQEAIEVEIQKRLNETGATSMRTAAGSVVQSTLTSYNVEDRAAFGQYIIGSGHWEATQLRPIKEYISDYAREHDGNLPPGVAVYKRNSISIKRPTKKD